MRYERISEYGEMNEEIFRCADTGRKVMIYTVKKRCLLKEVKMVCEHEKRLNTMGKK